MSNLFEVGQYVIPAHAGDLKKLGPRQPYRVMEFATLNGHVLVGIKEADDQSILHAWTWVMQDTLRRATVTELENELTNIEASLLNN